MVLSGAVLDVAVDVRVGSPAFGQYVSVVLDDRSHRQLWIPRGFAHGFLAMSEEAKFLYKCDASYDRANEMSIRWNDPAINIDWGAKQPISFRKRCGRPFTQRPDRCPAAL